jgi:excisionase family DNA binding protein
MRWCRQGRINAIKLGQKWLIPQEAVDEHLRRDILINGAERRK